MFCFPESDKFAVFKDVVHRIYDRKGRIEVEDPRDGMYHLYVQMY